MSSFMQGWEQQLGSCRSAVSAADVYHISGRLTRVTGLVVEAVGIQPPVGSGCMIRVADSYCVEAEVVGFDGERVFLMPTTDAYGLAPGAQVLPLDPPQRRHGLPAVPQPRRRAHDRAKAMPVGGKLLGRVLDACARPLDRQGPLGAEQEAPLYRRPYNPLERSPITEILDTGVRAINALLTVGRGQRMGLFAGSGVGKSILLGMMARYTTADVIVVGLIGERGREVREFIETILGADGMSRAVVVAAPADTSPLLRLQGAAYATTIAEHFRDEGRQVLLIMDSLTRYAMAQREIALAIGEPPATKGYPPSVFARLPQLVERAGNGPAGGGSITAFYTVLAEGDDQQDPVADAARAILDGHVVLSRTLADQGHYPAIDIESSISRAIGSLRSPAQLEHVRQFKALFSRHQRARDLISIGAYAAGSDAELDRAIALQPAFDKFLRQDMREGASYGDSVAALETVLSP